MSLLELDNLSKTYPGANGAVVRAVSEVSLTIVGGDVREGRIKALAAWPPWLDSSSQPTTS